MTLATRRKKLLLVKHEFISFFEKYLRNCYTLEEHLERFSLLPPEDATRFLVVCTEQ